MDAQFPLKLLSGPILSLQLPIKVGHQNTHTKVSTEHNKECLINISKYKFSLVISGLTTILKNVNNMVSAARGHNLPMFFSVALARIRPGWVQLWSRGLAGRA